MMETLLRGNSARPALPARPLRGVRAGMSLDSEEARPDEAEIATDLVRRIAAGDGAAEAALVERYSRGVLYLLRRLGAPPELADDLHQETFRIVIERLRRQGLEDPAGVAGLPRGAPPHPDHPRPPQDGPPPHRRRPGTAGADRPSRAGPARRGPARRGGRDRAAADRGDADGSRPPAPVAFLRRGGGEG